MATIVLVAHAPLASALQAVARHVYPDCSGLLRVVDVESHWSREVAEREVRAAVLASLAASPQADVAAAADPSIEAAGTREVLLLTDVFGATPCNAALALADSPQTRVLAGVNVPMLWRALCYAALPLDELAARALSGASQGVMPVVIPPRQNQPVPPLRHDQLHHHDQ